MEDLVQQDSFNFLITESKICQNGIKSANFIFFNDMKDLFPKSTKTFNPYDSSSVFIERSSMNSTTLLEKIDRFFQSILASLRRFKTEISDKINAKLRTAEMKSAFRNFKMKVSDLESQGKKEMEMVDVWGIDKTLSHFWKRLTKQAKRVITTKYKNIAKMDLDIQVFNETYQTAETEIGRLTNKKITVPISKAVNFVEDTITKRDFTLTRIDDYMKDIEQLQHEVQVMIDRREIYGMDALPEKISAVRRLVSKLGSFLHATIGKRIAKVIATIVLFCA